MTEQQAAIVMALRVGFSGLLLLALLASGCSPMARHAVLSKLVDGIPPYIPPEDRERLESEATVQARREAEKANRHERRARVNKRSFFLHDPFATDECFHCHSEPVGASSLASKQASRAPSRRGKVATGEGFLRTEITALCFECHDEFSPDRTPRDGLLLHGPVASGWCVACHDPHKSPNPSLLRYAPAARLCLQCHERSELAASTEPHLAKAPGEAYTPAAPRTRRAYRVFEKVEEERQSLAPVVKDCTRCHDPHRGRDHSLLRDQVAAEMSATDVVAPPAPAESGSPR
jgi:predicted CXXCH cytochrome family protein